MPHLPSERTVATLLRWFHLAAIFIWLALIPPTVLWWKNSIRWIGFMSIYALVMAHFTAYMASRTEKRELEQD
jgi:Trk-type K+ transport system membrane component